MKKLLIVAAIATPLLLTGCTGQQVRDAQEGVRQIDAEIAQVNDLLQEIDEAIDQPGLSDDLKDAARERKASLEDYLDRLETALADAEARLEGLELTDDSSVSNGLQSLGAILSGVAPLLGPYGAVALGVGGVAGAVGRSLGRRKGVDETLDVFENADVPVTVTKDLKNQQEILRKGNKAVAKGVARQIAKQGNG